MKVGAVVRYNTLLLVLTAGFCDSITFTAADELFSAHVTGNFIIFAYDVIHRVDVVTWVRLLTFPVFFGAVMIGGWLDSRLKDQYILLRVEGVVLIVGGVEEGCDYHIWVFGRVCFGWNGGEVLGAGGDRDAGVLAFYCPPKGAEMR